MHIAVASDHAGVDRKWEVVSALRADGHEVDDLGTDSTAPVDYPDYAEKLALWIVGGRAERGVLLCGSGVGASVAANKIPGIRAAVCHDNYSAHQGVEHDDMNVLVLGARIIAVELAKELARTFLRAQFSHEERHVRRLGKIHAIEERFCIPTRTRSTMTSIRADLASYAAAVAETTGRFERENVLNRLTQGEYTVWKPEPTEITNRMGWLTIADRMRGELPTIEKLVRDVHAAGYTDALLLGMGGSSLAPDVFRRTYGVAAGHLNLAVLDSTDPDAVASHASRLDPKRTLFIVSTKSGGTVETFSFFRFFYRWTVRAIGQAAAGAHFIAITDPGSGLVDVAKQYAFRETFLNDPNIGGRYSALSHFGLVPAALVGVDLSRLLDDAAAAERATDSAVRLGIILGELAARGVDKVTFVLSPPIAAFASWAEQLLAESTGKEGKGIVPVADEPLGKPDVYGKDRLFVHLRLANDSTQDVAVDTLRAAGHPVVRIDLSDVYDLGGQFFSWELATAIAGWRLAINPFDQPNVEAAKVLARQMVKSYETSGALPPLAPTAHSDGLNVYVAGDTAGASAGTAADAVRAFFKRVHSGDYVALQAYVEPTAAMTAALQQLRVAIRDQLRVATTVGYGPRFLHSTGQLHKGDGGHGVFLQIVTPPPATDTPIPDTADSDASHITFGVLKVAQSLGDRQALLEGGRRVLRVDPDHVPRDVARIATMIG